jgi:hypothetical protein
LSGALPGLFLPLALADIHACMSRPYVPTREKPKPADEMAGYRAYREIAKPGDWKTYAILGGTCLIALDRLLTTIL